MESGHLQKIKYSIHDASSFVAGYDPQKILTNKPSDSNSRWSSDSNTHPQYVTLKFEPAIVHALTFGKYEKTHTNNVKKFEIYGGLEPTSMIKLCEGSMRNDSVPETFFLRTTVGQERFPVAYLKIVPTQCWGSGFNYSLWYVELRGSCDKTAVLSGMDAVQKYRQHTAFRLCLKMFRELGMESCFEVLREQVTVPLEHKQLSLLYDVIVRQGNFSRAEELIAEAADRGYLTDFAAVQPPIPVWTQIVPELGELTPGMRGGHQMVLDSAGQMIYLFGGWDGARDLSDFWQYDLTEKRWKLISADTEEDGGPSPRSCHKMVVDSDNQMIYVIGRYVDQTVRTSEPLRNDFHMYDLLRKRWTVLSTDTFADGGPKLLFDHQIALDVERKSLYLFGGRVLERKSSDPGENFTVAGLYVYDIPNNSWRCLQPDTKSSIQASRNYILQPRLGHCIIFHPGNRNLYVIGGHYNKEPVKDMVAYNVDTEECILLGDADTGDTMPLGLTQRATLDLDLHEIYVYFGGGKGRNGSPNEYQEISTSSPNILWIFDINKTKWSICQSPKQSIPKEPSARYAHQLVYDTSHKLHYLFGGNASNTSATNKTRLDDFWQLQLKKPPGTEITRQITYILRKQCYRELCKDDPVTAVQYLREEVAAVLDKSSSTDVAEFHQLPSLLFADQLIRENDTTETSKTLTTHQRRVEIFSRICEFFPPDMTPPRENTSHNQDATVEKLESECAPTPDTSLATHLDQLIAFIQA